MTVSADPKTQIEMGKKLKKIRENKGLTQEEVGAKAEISGSYYARIERGEENPTNKVIMNICKALGIKSSEILPY